MTKNYSFSSLTSPSNTLWIFVFIALCFSLLSFGGVHQWSLSLIQLFFGAFAIKLSFFSRATNKSAVPRSISMFTLFLASLFVGAVVLEQMLQLGSHFTVKVGGVGLTPALPPLQFLKWIANFALFFVVFYCVRHCISNDEKGLTHVRRVLLLVGSIATLVALVHWFSDNGKLFWVFAPNSRFVSLRARWPFVNSNHLAHFLLPFLFLCAGELCVRLMRFLTYLTENYPTRRSEFARFFSRYTTGRKLMGLAVIFSIFLITLVVFLGTLSRGAWLSAALGSLVFLPAMIYLTREYHNPSPSQFSAHDSQHRSGKRRRRSSQRQETQNTPSPQKLFRTLLIPLGGILAFLLILFVRDQAREVISERLTYGLLAAQGDIRFQLLEDTWPLISHHWIFGVGADRWEVFHRMIMDSRLSGLNPEYLHSDPVQLFCEVGIFGIFSLLALLFIYIRKSLAAFLTYSRSELAKRRRYAWYVLATFSGLISLLLASFFDFPFRIPAISIYFASYLAYLSVLISDAESP